MIYSGIACMLGGIAFSVITAFVLENVEDEPPFFLVAMATILLGVLCFAASAASFYGKGYSDASAIVCRNCNFEIEENYDYCPNCGEKVIEVEK